MATINKKDSLKITDKLRQLASSSTSLDIKKLAGYHNLYRLRCGEYRIIYEVYEQILIIRVLIVGHRKDIYGRSKQFLSF